MSKPRPSPAPRQPPMPAALSIIESNGFADYRLIDSGGGRKLERFGKIIVDRPEPQALWRRLADEATWTGAHAVFAASGDEEGGRWRTSKPVPESWPVRLENVVTLTCRLSAFRHLGIFPEQLPHWRWMLAALKLQSGPERPRVLNLFGYTGAATLLAAHAGAEVTHVDASKKAIAWARENQAASALKDAPVRWILDDARKFVQREVRRRRTYDIILIDPPKFGRGPNNETWDLFIDLPDLLRTCAALVAGPRSALILTAYAIRASALMLDQLCREMLAAKVGRFESGELAIREEGGARAVPTSLFTRWWGHDLAI
ncbi:MAG: class I SAM-dependent methyltransferase [Hyphomicrobiaceae bacterium]